jgi:hypothetical protein
MLIGSEKVFWDDLMCTCFSLTCSCNVKESSFNLILSSRHLFFGLLFQHSYRMLGVECMVLSEDTINLLIINLSFCVMHGPAPNNSHIKIYPKLSNN